jgi:transposase
VYLRTLLIHGARNVLRFAGKHKDRHSKWALEVARRRGVNRATVALANKNARAIWVLMTDPQANFDGNHVPEKYKEAA